MKRLIRVYLLYIISCTPLWPLLVKRSPAEGSRFMAALTTWRYMLCNSIRCKWHLAVFRPLLPLLRSGSDRQAARRLQEVYYRNFPDKRPLKKKAA